MATITIGGIDYPSYATLAEADAYLAADALLGPGWAATSTDRRNVLLVSATRVMTGLAWCDEIPDIDSPPEAVKNVTIQLAAMIGQDPEIMTGINGDAALRRAKAGSVEVEYFRAESVVTAMPGSFPPGLWAQLVSAGLVGCGSGDLPPFFSGDECCNEHVCKTCLAPAARCGCYGRSYLVWGPY